MFQNQLPLLENSLGFAIIFTSIFVKLEFKEQATVISRKGFSIHKFEIKTK